jgi:hypothetical protein
MAETGTKDDVIWAQQAIDALLTLKEAAGTARDAGNHATDPEILDKQCGCFREAADAGTVLNAARRSKLHKKRNALATRMRDRADDYLRFARDLRVPFDNNQAEQGHQDEQAAYQDLRLHALDVRRRGLLRHPFLRRHRRPPRHRRSRRPHLRRPSRPLDPRAGLTEKTVPGSRYRVHIRNDKLRQTYPVTLELARCSVPESLAGMPDGTRSLGKAMSRSCCHRLKAAMTLRISWMVG